MQVVTVCNCFDLRIVGLYGRWSRRRCRCGLSCHVCEDDRFRRSLENCALVGIVEGYMLVVVEVKMLVSREVISGKKGRGFM
jgi:hypothetical protein